MNLTYITIAVQLLLIIIIYIQHKDNIERQNLEEEDKVLYEFYMDLDKILEKYKHEGKIDIYKLFPYLHYLDASYLDILFEFEGNVDNNEDVNRAYHELSLKIIQRRQNIMKYKRRLSQRFYRKIFCLK